MMSAVSSSSNRVSSTLTPENRPPRLWPVRDRPRRSRPSQDPVDADSGDAGSLADRSSLARGSDVSSGRSDQASGGCVSIPAGAGSAPLVNSDTGSAARSGISGGTASGTTAPDAVAPGGNSVGATGATSGAS